MTTTIEPWDAACECADRAVAYMLTRMTVPQVVRWFYDESTLPNSDEWNELVLGQRWDVDSSAGIFRMWDELGRPDYTRSDYFHDYGGDGTDPDRRRFAQDEARLDECGVTLMEAFPGAIIRAAEQLGWSVRWGGDFPDGSVAMSSGGMWHALEDCCIPVLVPPVAMAVA